MPRCSTAPSVPALDRVSPARSAGVVRFLGTWRPLALAGALVLAGQLLGGALEQRATAAGPDTAEGPSESAPLLLPAPATQSEGALRSDEVGTESGIASRAS